MLYNWMIRSQRFEGGHFEPRRWGHYIASKYLDLVTLRLNVLLQNRILCKHRCFHILVVFGHVEYLPSTLIIAADDTRVMWREAVSDIQRETTLSKKYALCIGFTSNTKWGSSSSVCNILNHLHICMLFQFQSQNAQTTQNVRTIRHALMRHAAIHALRFPTHVA